MRLQSLAEGDRQLRNLKHEHLPPCMSAEPLRGMNGSGNAYAATNGTDTFASFGAAPTAADMSLFDDSSHYSSHYSPVAFPAPSAPPARSPPTQHSAPAPSPPRRRSLSAPDPQVTVADPQVCDQRNLVAVPGTPTPPHASTTCISRHPARTLCTRTAIATRPQQHARTRRDEPHPHSPAPPPRSPQACASATSPTPSPRTARAPPSPRASPSAAASPTSWRSRRCSRSRTAASSSPRGPSSTLARSAASCATASLSAAATAWSSTCCSSARTSARPARLPCCTVRVSVQRPVLHCALAGPRCGSHWQRHFCHSNASLRKAGCPRGRETLAMPAGRPVPPTAMPGRPCARLRGACSALATSDALTVFLTTHDELRTSTPWRALAQRRPTVASGVGKLLKQMVGRENLVPAPQEAAASTKKSHDVVRQVREAVYHYRYRGCAPLPLRGATECLMRTPRRAPWYRSLPGAGTSRAEMERFSGRAGRRGCQRSSSA